MTYQDALAAVFKQARHAHNDRYGKRFGKVSTSIEAAREDAKKHLAQQPKSTLNFAL